MSNEVVEESGGTQSRHSRLGGLPVRLRNLPAGARWFGPARIVGQLLVLLAACLCTVHADHHKHVAGDKLEAKECYILKAPKTKMSGINLLEGITVPKGNVICVRELLTIKGERYYRVLIMKMGTLDRSQHVTAWVKVERLMEHGVWLSY